MLLAQVFALQPKYGNDVAELAPTLASNLADVSAALAEAAQRLRSGADGAAMQSLSGAVPHARTHEVCIMHLVLGC